MDHLLLDLEIDAACWEFMAKRILAMGGPAQPQPVVTYLDAMPDEPQRNEDPDPWDELTVRAARYGAGPETTMEIAERVLGRMEG